MKTILALLVLLALPLAAADLNGVWKGEVEVAGNHATPEFTFKVDGTKLTGTYKGMLGEAPISGTVEGKQVTWVLKVDYNGDKVTITYKATLESDTTMKGTVDFNGQADGTFTARKQ